MRTPSPMDDPCDHCSADPSFRTAPFDSAPSLHFAPPLQHPVFSRVDLTSCLQFCDVHDFTATMASDQNEVDMEAFQRLSDSYQPDVQVRMVTYWRPPYSLNRNSDISRDLSFATDFQSRP